MREQERKENNMKQHTVRTKIAEVETETKLKTEDETEAVKSIKKDN